MAIYLLDTCAVSELIKSSPNQLYSSWLQSIPSFQLYISSVTAAEIVRGIELLPHTPKKIQLLQWYNTIAHESSMKILDFDLKSAEIWGRIIAILKLKGQNLPLIDSLIGAISLAHNATLVTRNVKDFEPMGVNLLNPWALST